MIVRPNDRRIGRSAGGGASSLRLRGRSRFGLRKPFAGLSEDGSEIAEEDFVLAPPDERATELRVRCVGTQRSGELLMPSVAASRMT